MPCFRPHARQPCGEDGERVQQHLSFAAHARGACDWYVAEAGFGVKGRLG